MRLLIKIKSPQIFEKYQTLCFMLLKNLEKSHQILPLLITNPNEGVETWAP